MFPVRFSVSNQVKYYKTVNEAFAAANPLMRNVLLNMEPVTAAPRRVGAFEALFTLINRSIGKEPIKPQNPKEMLEKSLELINPEKFKKSEFINNAVELLKKYINRGQVGEVLLKQKLQREGGQLLEEIKNLGLRI